jgi:hypothetical protein
MAKSQSTPAEESALAVALPEDMQEMFDTQVNEQPQLSFNILKIMRESAQFELADGVYEKEMTGHVMYLHSSNQWWETSFDQRGEETSPIPNCYSTDGIKPDGGDKIQSEMCVACPLNQFGSGRDGKGKACRNTRRLLFLPDDAVIPVVLVAPPTSVGKKRPLQVWLNGVPNEVAKAYKALNIKRKNGQPITDYYWAHVHISLFKEKFESGEASILDIRTLDVLTPDDEDNRGKIRNIFTTLKECKEAYLNEVRSYVEADQPDPSPESQSAECPEVDNEQIPF